jgi:hypothetical protein
MTHFSVEAWTDFVRQMIPEASQVPMREHRDACRECAAIEKALRSVVELATREPEYLPPPSAVRCAKALYRVQPPAREPNWTMQVARLILPSWQEPLMQGVRGGAIPMHHLLYQRGTTLLDMRLEPRAERGLVTMTGQITDPAKSDAAFGRRPVVVLKGREEMARTETNQFGEFQLEFRPGEDLILVVDLECQVFLVSPLPSSAMAAVRIE